MGKMVPGFHLSSQLATITKKPLNQAVRFGMFSAALALTQKLCLLQSDSSG